MISEPAFHHHTEEYCRRCDDFREGTVTGWPEGVEFECANCGYVELVEDYSDFEIEEYAV